MRKQILLLSLSMAVGLLPASGVDAKTAYEQQLQASIDTMATKVESTYSTIIDNRDANYGADIDLALKKLKLSGEKFKDFTVAMDADAFGDKCKVRTKIKYDNEKLLNADSYVTKNMMYVMLPDYSKKALGTKLESSNSIELPKMPAPDQIKAQITEYGKMLASTFQYTGTENNVTFNDNNFKFDATVMTGECTAKELETTMNAISDKFEKSELYKAFGKYNELQGFSTGTSLETKDNKVFENENAKLQLKLYAGSDNNMAYEIVNADSKTRFVFVTDGKSWSMYGVDNNVMAFELTNHIELNGTAISGYLKFAADGQALKLEFTDAKIANNQLSECNYKLLAGEKESKLTLIASGKFAKNDKKTTITVKFDNKEYKVAGELEINVTEREAKAFKLPKSYIDSSKSDKWLDTLDMKKVQKDVLKYQGLFNKLNSALESNSNIY